MATDSARRDGFIARRMPRTLAAAAHVTAVASWLFVLGVLLFRWWLNGFDSGGGFFVWIVFMFVLAPIVGTVMLGALAVAAVGLTITLPLAISWLRTPNREGDGGFALAHVTAAVVVGLVTLAWIVT